MKKTIYAVLMLLLSWLCAAGQLNINFNDSTPAVSLDFADIAKMEFVQSAVSTPMIKVQGGTYTRGFNGVPQALSQPAHQVTLDSFYLGKYEVTQEEWIAVMGFNPSWYNGQPQTTTPDYGVNLKRPVEQVSWYDVIVYCNKRSFAENLEPCYTINGSTNPADWGVVPEVQNATWDAVECRFSANGWRLPTEAEWEFAAKGGNSSQGFLFSGDNNILTVAWSSYNSGDSTHSVGVEKMPTINAANELGFFDMTGNVWERCWDRYAVYSAEPQTNPTGGTTNTKRISRGGSHSMPELQSRNYFRNATPPMYRSRPVGFRLARTSM